MENINLAAQVRTCIVSRWTIRIVLSTFCSVGFSEPTPSSTSLCDMPSQRGTAMYNKYCGSSGAATEPATGGGYTPQQQMMLQGAGVLGNALGQELGKAIFGSPEDNARKAQEAAVQQQRQAELQRQAEQETMRRQEEAKQRILGQLKGAESSVDLQLKTDSDQSLTVATGRGAFGSTVVVPVGSGAPSVGGLQLKLGDDAEKVNSGVQAGCKPSQDASVVDLCALGNKPAIVDPLIVKNGSTAPLNLPPANSTFPRVAEIENSPGAAEAHKGFQAIIDKEWPAAIVDFKNALLKDPNNAALKRSLDLAEYTQARRLEIAHEKSPIFLVIDVWQNGDRKAALDMLTRIDEQHPELHSRVADVRHSILAVEKYLASPAYRAELAKTAQAQNQLVFNGALDMAQKSFVDQYVDTGMRYMAAGNIPQARLMLKTALASDDSRGDVRELLNTLDSISPISSLNNLPLPLKADVSAIHN